MLAAQVLDVCREVTELDLTDWKARIEGKGVEVLPEVTLHNHSNYNSTIIFGSCLKGGLRFLLRWTFHLQFNNHIWTPHCSGWREKDAHRWNPWSSQRWQVKLDQLPAWKEAGCLWHHFLSQHYLICMVSPPIFPNRFPKITFYPHIIWNYISTLSETCCQVSVSRTPGHTKHFQTIFLTRQDKELHKL